MNMERDPFVILDHVPCEKCGGLAKVDQREPGRQSTQLGSRILIVGYTCTNCGHRFRREYPST